ncbi:MAG: isoprenyl transferase [Gammaproteobacteria bacterium]|nr:isoprenyl transferase [Gammaproteobacteria bacterium]
MNRDLAQENKNGTDVPQHVAIIMDGNGRWAERRGLPRVAGHKSGVETVRKIVEAAGEFNVKVLTLFAFSSENWRRPESEVGLLMELLLTALRQEIKKLVKNNVRLSFIGVREAFGPKMNKSLVEAEAATAENTGLNLVIALNYGGRWDIAQAARRVSEDVLAGKYTAEQVDEALVGKYMSLSEFPEPDLFIRTSGEQRISNFLLWQLAYTELYFTEVFWPDFSKQEFAQAIEWFKGRQRRFGLTGQQIKQTGYA